MSQQELKRLLTYEVSRQYNNLPKIMGIKYARKIMYSKKQYELGLNVVEKDITPSPYAELRDIILGQADFVKRQNDIIRFVNQFTRAAIDSEDQFWLYCPVTDTKLLPTYFNTLALAFNQQQNSSNYAEYSRQLEIVCAERGTISDDGDAIVDKYSGYFIRKIEFLFYVMKYFCRIFFFEVLVTSLIDYFDFVRVSSVIFNYVIFSLLTYSNG